MNKNKTLDAIILMGPFGSGKSYLGRQLHAKSIAQYTDLEPIVYNLFSKEGEFDVDQASKYIRSHYFDTLSSTQKLIIFESTGVVQRPLLLEVMKKFQIDLAQVCAPKEICLERVSKRNIESKHPVNLSKASEFYDYWMNEIAPTYNFALHVDGLDEQAAIQAIKRHITVKL